MSGYKGLVKKFPVGRPLTPQDRKYHLDQREKIDLEPYPDLVVIQLNSTYLDVVDKYFPGKGFLTLMVIGFSAVFLIGGGMIVSDTLDILANGERFPGALRHGVLTSTLTIAFGLGIIWFGRVEWRGYTHYPIRLNHKAQLVHVFRKDGSVLSVPWADLYFTLDYDFSYFRFWEIHAHVLSDDRETVLETFVLGTSEGVDPGGLAILHAHWEFFRRYMAEGPEAVAGFVKYAMPVSGKRESYRSGYEVIMSSFRHPHPIARAMTTILWPVLFLQSLVRWLVMRTCRMPRWPADIEAANVVAPDDPFDIDSRINPPELR
jgi:hypothetical protein